MSKYTTSLETLKYEVSEILEKKASEVGSAGVVDYVAFAIENLNNNIGNAKKVKRELDAYIKDLSSNIDTIKQDTAKWLRDNGIGKLEGMGISSLTTYDPEPEMELIIHDSECELLKDKDFQKTTLDKTAVKNFIINSEIDYSEFVELKKTYKQPTIKINKKRG